MRILLRRSCCDQLLRSAEDRTPTVTSGGVKSPGSARNFAAMNPLDSLTPDPRWESLATSYGDLVAASGDWPVAHGAPPEVARMLAVSRHLFCHAWFIYDFLMVAAVQSLIAIEAALRHLLEEEPRRRGPRMRNLVERAVSQGFIPQEQADNVLAAVDLRNSWLHVGGQMVISPGMAQQVVAASHAVVADLYSNRTGASSTVADDPRADP
jgi:hypothetical protein